MIAILIQLVIVAVVVFVAFKIIDLIITDPKWNQVCRYVLLAIAVILVLKILLTLLAVVPPWP